MFIYQTRHPRQMGIRQWVDEENLKNNIAGFNNDLKWAGMTEKTGSRVISMS